MGVLVRPPLGGSMTTFGLIYLIIGACWAMWTWLLMNKLDPDWVAAHSSRAHTFGLLAVAFTWPVWVFIYFVPPRNH